MPSAITQMDKPWVCEETNYYEFQMRAPSYVWLLSISCHPFLLEKPANEKQFQDIL